MQKNAKKMPNYLHISKKSSIFAADLGMVPTITIKYSSIMTKECVFRVEVEGMLWRVVKYPKLNRYGAHLYKIEHDRRVYWKDYRMCAQLAIEECLRFAFGCKVDVAWGIAL